MLQAGYEAIHTAVALGHRPVPIFGLADMDASNLEGVVDAMLDAVMKRWSLPHTRTTVLQDWMKGRRSEVDQINGLVLEQQSGPGGRRSCPANARTVEVAHRIERGELAPQPANAELLVNADG
jgi:2-dehydropantoate 2-reductase